MWNTSWAELILLPLEILPGVSSGESSGSIPRGFLQGISSTDLSKGSLWAFLQGFPLGLPLGFLPGVCSGDSSRSFSWRFLRVHHLGILPDVPSSDYCCSSFYGFHHKILLTIPLGILSGDSTRDSLWRFYHFIWGLSYFAKKFPLEILSEERSVNTSTNFFYFFPKNHFRNSS